MKKSLFSMLMLAMSAMTIVSCSSDDDEELGLQQKKGSITFIATDPEVDADTRTEFGPGCAPFWSKNDQIKAFGDYDATTILNFTGDNARPAATAQFNMEYNDYWEGEQRWLTNTLYVYHGNTGFSCNEQGDVDFTLKAAQKPARNQFDAAADILVAKPVAIDANIDYTTDPIQIRFRRLTGIVRLNILDKTKEGKFFNGKPVSSVKLTTNDPANDFTGKLEGNFVTGVFNKVKAYKYERLTASGLKYSVGEKDNSIYLSVLPTKIAKGKTFDITITFMDGSEYKKTLAAPADMDIAASKITTFNVSFKEEDVPASGEPVISGNVITMDGMGLLTPEIINKALGSSSKLAIKGNINAKDIDALLKVLVTTTIDLDLSDAVIKGDKVATYTDCHGRKAKITRDNLIPQELFSNEYRACNLSSLKLPKETVEIEKWAFSNTPALEVYIPYKVKTIGENLFSIESGIQTLYMLCADTTDGIMMDNTFFDGGNDNTSSGVNLVINEEWYYDPNGYYPDPDTPMWMDNYWSAIETVIVDANGDIVR